MNEVGGIGRILLIAGLGMAFVGVVLVAAPHLPALNRLGRLPGDVTFEKGSFTLFIPIVSSIVLSILLTVVLNIFIRR